MDGVIALPQHERELLRELIGTRLIALNEVDHKPLGTGQLVWPQDCPKEDYFFDLEKFTKNEVVQYYTDHFLQALGLTNELGDFEMAHKADFCQSVPERLKIISCNQPQRRRLSHHDMQPGDYCYLIRIVMDGDDVVSIAKNELLKKELDDPCALCQGHEDTDKCTRFLSPSERHVRLRNVNFTLMLMGLSQICPTCLKREYKHPYFEECRTRQSCAACQAVGHHTAMCTSGTHVVATATSTSQPSEEPATLDVGILRMICEKDEHIRMEQKKNIAIARKCRTDLIAFDYIESCRNPQLREKPFKVSDNFDVDDNFEKARLLSLHIWQYDKYKPNVKRAFDDSLVKLDYYTDICEYLIQFKKMFSCSRKKCESGMKAGYFCPCGTLRLCAPCLFGSSTMIYKWQDERMIKCFACHDVIVVPKQPGDDSCAHYIDTIQIVSELMDYIMQALDKWVVETSPPPSKIAFKELVSGAVYLVRKQFNCKLCKEVMDCEEHMIMKSTCQCGFLVCRECLRQAEWKLKCGMCSAIIEDFGVCMGLTLISSLSHTLAIDSGILEGFSSPIKPNPWCSPTGTIRMSLAPAQLTQPNSVDINDADVDIEIDIPFNDVDTDVDFIGDEIEKDDTDKLENYFQPIQQDEEDMFDDVTIGGTKYLVAPTAPVLFERNPSPSHPQQDNVNGGEGNVNVAGAEDPLEYYFGWERVAYMLCDVLDQRDIHPDVMPTLHAIPAQLHASEQPDPEIMADRLYEFLDLCEKKWKDEGMISNDEEGELQTGVAGVSQPIHPTGNVVERNDGAKSSRSTHTMRQTPMRNIWKRQDDDLGSQKTTSSKSDTCPSAHTPPYVGRVMESHPTDGATSSQSRHTMRSIWTRPNEDAGSQNSTSTKSDTCPSAHTPSYTLSYAERIMRESHPNTTVSPVVEGDEEEEDRNGGVESGPSRSTSSMHLSSARPSVSRCGRFSCPPSRRTRTDSEISVKEEPEKDHEEPKKNEGNE